MTQFKQQAEWETSKGIIPTIGETSVEFYILLTVHAVMIHGKWPTWRTILFYVFILILYMFQAPHAHHQKNQLYQYNLWYTSL